ncbi:fimbrial outer membrane usher protein [Enterobacteriaceae bacterium C23F]
MNIQSKNKNRVIRFTFLTLMIKSSLVAHYAQAADYRFDSHLLAGSALGENVDLDRFNESQTIIPEGQQTLDISLNGKKVISQVAVRFIKTNKTDESAQPCIDEKLIDVLQIKRSYLKRDGAQCLTLDKISRQASWRLQQSTLTLDFLIPQVVLNRLPRDYIPVSEWQAGEPLIFLRHNTNFTRNVTNETSYNYLWSMVNIGANAGMWQLRHQANLRYRHSSDSGDAYKWNAVRTWGQRPLPALSSELTVGDAYTDNSVFGSLSFNGIKIATDKRMWPQGKRGYAPEVRGVANTNAHVVVRQANRVIYETQVPPGPFLIDDLYNTGSQGDLQVQVIEADGKSAYFTVPYASVPNSMRPGNFSYQFAAGKVRDYYSVPNAFTEGAVQYGLNNSFTSNSGIRVANNYQALLAGGVFASEAGALSLNTTWSHARVENDQTKSGWRAEAAYSKSFVTNTNLVLAAYRYSTSGYRDLEDVLGVRRQSRGGSNYYSDTLKQRNRFTATVSQNMDEYGTLALSGSSTDYYGSRSRITELQLSWNNMWKKVTYNINVGRQRSSWNNDYVYSVNDADYNSSRYEKYTENVVSVGISIPLDWRDTRSNVSFDMMKDKDSRSLMTTLSGSAGKNSDYTYSVYANHDKYNEQTQGNSYDMRWGGNAQARTNMGSFNASYAQSDDYHQLGLGTAGTLVAHSGGLTYGPYASDTFALVEAKGATGARVDNAQGAKINAFGYAIVPSVTPYRYNTVSIDGTSMNQNVEVEGGNKRVVPVYGAVPKVVFKTVGGSPALIDVRKADGSAIPMGAEVKDPEGNSVGMVGQNGQVYARLPKPTGKLVIQLQQNKTCSVNYALPQTTSNDNNFARLDGTCI